MGKRIISRRRGKGGNFRAPSHRYMADVKLPSEKSATVVGLFNDPGRTAPLAKVTYASGRMGFVLATDGLRIGQTINVGAEAEVKQGNVMAIGRMPEGTRVNNIERTPGDGGKFVRSAGTEATVIGHENGMTTIQLPSGSFKQLHSHCKATIGIVAGSGRTEKPIAKAGKAHHMVKPKARVWPEVRKVAMDPVYHPHGGGARQHVGGPGESRRDSPPGQKVGAIAPKRRGRRR